MSENHSNNERAEALRSLIQYRQPLDSALSRLSSLGWDSKGPVVYLQWDDVARILDRFLAQEMTADQVTDWADLNAARTLASCRAASFSEMSSFALRIRTSTAR